ncbi:MAG: DUF4199 family protein [Steroidobacteraceae bacterium]
MTLSLPLRYGIAGGVAALLLTLVPYASLGTGPGIYAVVESVGYVSMLAAMTAVYFAARRRSAEPGDLRGRDLLRLGASVSAVAGLVYAAGAWFAYEVLLPGTLPRLLAAYEQHLRSQAMSLAELNAALARLESGRRGFLSPPFQAAVQGFTLAVVGLAVTLYTAFRFRTPPAQRG